jgi:hypothetical protein
MPEISSEGVNEPKQDRIGNDYREGTNPNPGGEIDTGDSLVPPYDERTTGGPGPEPDATTEAQSLEARAESVRRQKAGEDAPKEANPESLVGPTGGSPGKEPPKGTGESINRHGEDVAKREGKEAGRDDAAEDDSEARRPTGSSTSRDLTGIDPQEGPRA